MLAAQQTLGNESPAYHLLTPREQMERRIAQNKAMDARLGQPTPRKRGSGSGVNTVMKAQLAELAALRELLAAHGVAL